MNTLPSFMDYNCNFIGAKKNRDVTRAHLYSFYYGNRKMWGERPADRDMNNALQFAIFH